MQRANWLALYQDVEGSTINLLKSLVQTATGTTRHVAGITRLQTTLAGRFKQLGFLSKRHKLAERGDFLQVFERPSNTRPGKPLVLLAHIDTVYNDIDRPSLSLDGDRMKGPGALDLKAGVMMALTALRLVRLAEGRRSQTPRRPVRVLINSAEEAPTAESAQLVRELTTDAHCVLGLEFGREGGKIVAARKGRMVVQLTCRGVAGHAGNRREDAPHSSIGRMMEVLQALPSLRAEVAGLQVEPTVLKAGSLEATNVAPAEAVVVLDLRVPPGMDTKVQQAVATFSARFGTESKILYQTSARNNALAEDSAGSILSKIQKVSVELKLIPECIELAGGLSDLNFVSPEVPAFDALGPLGEGAHNAELEWVSLSSLRDCTIRLAELLRRL